MKKIFIVTSGAYSDYGIDAVFSTEELAQKFIDSFKQDNYNDMYIEEWPLDPNEQHLKQGRKPFFLKINKKGDVTDIKIKTSASGFKSDMPTANISFTANDEWMNIECFADDDAHAVKIAGEKRTQILANNIWGSRQYHQFIKDTNAI